MGKLDNLANMVNEAIKTGYSSDHYKGFLLFHRRFRKYSFRNRCLIYYQKPFATEVANFNEWKEKGSPVKKNEIGIEIYVYQGEWKTGFVFDISQVSTMDSSLKREDESSRKKLDQNILISIFKQVVNEKLLSSNKQSILNQIEAESIVFLLMHDLDIDTTQFDFNNVEDYYKDKEIQQLNDSIKKIVQIAKALLTLIIISYEEKQEKLKSVDRLRKELKGKSLAERISIAKELQNR